MCSVCAACGVPLWTGRDGERRRSASSRLCPGVHRSTTCVLPPLARDEPRGVFSWVGARRGSWRRMRIVRSGVPWQHPAGMTQLIAQQQSCKQQALNCPGMLCGQLCLYIRHTYAAGWLELAAISSPRPVVYMCALRVGVRAPCSAQSLEARPAVGQVTRHGAAVNICRRAAVKHEQYPQSCRPQTGAANTGRFDEDGGRLPRSGARRGRSWGWEAWRGAGRQGRAGRRA